MACADNRVPIKERGNQTVHTLLNIANFFIQQWGRKIAQIEIPN
jgi:carbonic anhydrase